MPYVGDDFELDMNGGAGGHRRKGMKGMILDADGNVIAHVFGHAEVVNTSFKFVRMMAPGGKDMVVPAPEAGKKSTMDQMGEDVF